MKPTRVEKEGGEYILVNQCIKCGYEKRNKTNENDNFEEVLNIAKQSIK
jgi:Zn ribbon nucleic-acid-binding protein